MPDSPNSVQQKALKINLDARKFGTLAEIGAGQEVARWFFHVGKAAGTVAKTISAYAMGISDSLYGPAQSYPAQSYVCRERLEVRLVIGLVGRAILPAAAFQPENRAVCAHQGDLELRGCRAGNFARSRLSSRLPRNSAGCHNAQPQFLERRLRRAN